MTNIIRIPPHNVPVVDSNGQMTPAWRSFFNEQVVSTVNTVVANQETALTTNDTTVAQLLLHNS
jgi:hypothetical protein